MNDLVIPDFLKRQGEPNGRALTAVPDKVFAENLDQDRPADQLVAEAQQAWLRLKSAGRQTWRDWYLIGLALVAGRGQIMHVLAINEPQGNYYRAAIKDWLQKNGFADIHKTTRSLLLDLIDHEQEVTEMMVTWTEAERAERNSPSVVNGYWKRWRKKLSGGEGQQEKPRARNELRQQNKELAAQIEQLTAHVAELEAARETEETEAEENIETGTAEVGRKERKRHPVAKRRHRYDATLFQIQEVCDHNEEMEIPPELSAQELDDGVSTLTVAITALNTLLARLQKAQGEKIQEEEEVEND